MYSGSIYILDSQDRLIEANESFWSFARQNGWAVKPDAVLGRPVWDFMQGAGDLELYRKLFGLVREHREPVCFPFRCDSPDMRRHMTMTVSPGHEGAVVLVAELDSERPRNRAGAGHNAPPVAICSCGRVEHEGQWYPLLQALSCQFLEVGAAPIETRDCPACAFRSEGPTSFQRYLKSGGRADN